MTPNDVPAAHERGPRGPRRRLLLAGGAGACVALLAPSVRASPEAMASAIRAFTGDAPTASQGVRLDIPLLQESGNSVPVTVSVDSPMTEQDHVRAIAIFNERNPLPQVATFHLSPRAGRARVSTRIRLGDSQQVVAVARMSDGSYRSAAVEVIVTLPACVEAS